MKTAEQIARETDDKEGIANIRAINAKYRYQDESRLYPILGRFNVTERAIRQARKFQRDSSAVYGLEYCYLLEQLMSAIVNDSRSAAECHLRG
jgi:hypothetical protein